MLSKYFLRCLPIILAVVMLSGCSKSEVPDPPASRAELVGRLFEALQYKRDQEALVIIGKLLALDPDDVDLMDMRDRVTINLCTRSVQKMIDAGKLDEALRIVGDFRRNNPTLPGLRMLHAEVSELILLRDAAKALAEAQDTAALVTQLEKIAPLAGKYPQAGALHKDIKMRRIQLSRMRAEEAARARESAPDKSSERAL